MTTSHPEELTRLRDSVDALRKTVDQRLAEDPVREAAFEKLYGELKSYKDGFLREAERPLLLDLLLLFDSMVWFHQSLVKEEMSSDVVADSFQFLLDELLEVLYRREVVPMEPTTDFDPAVHRAVQVQAAPTPEDDNKVASVVKRGFVREDKTMRPEEVVVYKWKGGGKS